MTQLEHNPIKFGPGGYEHHGVQWPICVADQYRTFWIRNHNKTGKRWFVTRCPLFIFRWCFSYTGTAWIKHIQWNINTRKHKTNKQAQIHLLILNMTVDLNITKNDCRNIIVHYINDYQSCRIQVAYSYTVCSITHGHIILQFKSCTKLPHKIQHK